MKFKIHPNFNKKKITVAKEVSIATKSVEYLDLQAGL